MPEWLRIGVYAIYRFDGAYGFEGPPVWSDEYGWVLTNFGPGYYRWEVIGLDGSLATLRVSISTEKLNKDIDVVLNAETMDLIEDGKVWGKAWFWIDLAKLPPTSELTVIRNITFCHSWFNITLDWMRVSRIHSLTGEAGLKPVETGLGPVDLVVVAGGRTESLKNLKYKVDGVTAEHIISGEFGSSGDYDAKSGLLLAGNHIDDILAQKFGIWLFEEMAKSPGEASCWLILEDTNVPIGISGGGTSMLGLLRSYYPYILISILISIFIITFVAGRRRIRP